MKPIVDDKVTKKQRRRIIGIALVLAAGIFLFHAAVLLELSRHLLAAHQWMSDAYGPVNAGRIMVTGCFVSLFITHIIEAGIWGLFFLRKGLAPSLTEGVYFAASSITALGYGDVVLRPPWRILGPLVAINGLLIFGCSTAFLFLVLHKVWGAF